MDQKEHQEERQLDLYVVGIVGGAIIGWLIAEWAGIGGVLGALIGAFVVDAFRGLRGTQRFIKETEHLIEQARNVWERQQSQRSTREDAPDIKDASHPLPDQEPADGEIYPSA